MTSPATFLRHSWSDPYREVYATKRRCWNCGLMKITRHEPGILPWVEYWRDGARIRMDEDGRRVPACDQQTSSGAA